MDMALEAFAAKHGGNIESIRKLVHADPYQGLIPDNQADTEAIETGRELLEMGLD